MVLISTLIKKVKIKEFRKIFVNIRNLGEKKFGTRDTFTQYSRFRVEYTVEKIQKRLRVFIAIMETENTVNGPT